MILKNVTSNSDSDEGNTEEQHHKKKKSKKKKKVIYKFNDIIKFFLFMKQIQ